MSRKHLLLFSFIVLLYFATRLINLTLLPIFTDEAIYLRWGQIGVRDAAHRFLSLEDGKQPLFIWLMYPLLKIFSDPLVAGRMVSILAGFFSLIGMMLLARLVFGRRTVIPAALLYIISPFFLFYDRLALYDSLTTMFSIYALLLEILLITTLRLDTALLLGFVIGGGLLTKSSAQFSLFLLPASLILAPKKILRWLPLAILASVIALGFSWVIKLSPLAHMVGLKNNTFVLPLSAFIADPFSRIIGNLKGLTDWLIRYLTWPWFIGIFASAFLAVKTSWRQTLLLLVWFLFPYFTLAAFGIVLYPRFILFMTFPLLLIFSHGLSRLPLAHLLSLWPAYISLLLIFNPLAAPLPQVDREQFMDNWPSGYGIPEVIEFIKTQTEPIFVATEGTFGLTPYALSIYLPDTPTRTIKGYWPISEGMPEILTIAKTKTTYVIFKDTQTPAPEWPLELVNRYQKGRGNVYLSLYRVKLK